MLGAIQSLYSGCRIAVQIGGWVGPSVPSCTGVKQGCPLSPTLFGLFMDGLHRFLQSRCPSAGVSVQGRAPLSGVSFADDATLLATSWADMQAMVAAVDEFCDLTGMQLSTPKTKVLVVADDGQLRDAILVKGQPLEVVLEHKVLGLQFTASAGVRGCCTLLRRGMWGAWGRIQSEYGRLQCAESLWLRLQLFNTCVPSAGLYGSEVWGGLRLGGEVGQARQALATAHLGMLKMLFGLRRSTETNIVYRELGQAPLDHTWLLRSAKFWNSIARRQFPDLYCCVLQDCCRDAVTLDTHNWARDMWQILRDLGYFLPLSVVEIPLIDIATLCRKLEDRQAQPWQGLAVCPRTCPSRGVARVTYQRLMARPAACGGDVLTLRLPVRKLRQLLRFRTGCHNLPVDVGRRRGVERHARVCTACDSGQVGDEQHLAL